VRVSALSIARKYAGALEKDFRSQRTTDTEQCMRILEESHGIWSCKSYYRCTQVCLKRIKVTEDILKTKKKILQQLHPKKEQET
jgi:succinate dehydrogenase/fumarate reductase-like Fe-S protein